MWGAIGSAVAAGANLLGGNRANKGRREEAEKDRTFQSGQADRAMRFSERMRNTSWQAGVADMEAAGINPALAYSKGGASSPMGAAGSGSRADQQNEVAGAVSSALQYKRLQAEISAIKAGVKRTEAETDAVQSRPIRILEEPVNQAVEGMNRVIPGILREGKRAYQIGKFEIGSSARQIANATREAVARIQRSFMQFRATIGPNRTGNRERK